MKKVLSNFQCQNMYVQHFITSNTKKIYHKIHHTPDTTHIWKIIRCYPKKNQMNNWMTIIKNDSRRMLKNSCIIIYGHIPQNGDVTKLAGGGTEKAKDQNRKTDHSDYKLQGNTSRSSNRIQKKRKYCTDIFRCILHLRTIGTKQNRWFLSLGQKSNPPIQSMPP